MLLYVKASVGSPPHMRGKGRGPLDALGDQGITPAYAGKRKGAHELWQKLKDHPRICGEKHVGGRVRIFGEGITPAYAGKSDLLKLVIVIGRDHPRICGEKIGQVQAATINEGSPPHMRGKVVFGLVCHAAGGITPAYAGKRRFHCGFYSIHRDHPRICGEKCVSA